MRIAKEGYAFILVALGLMGAAAVFGWLVLSAFLALVSLAMIGFFRDPDRKSPVGEAIVVAPADGKVVSIERVTNGRLLGRESQQLSIFLSPLDVHVNRSPIQGCVEQREYQAGKFLAAYRGKASSENEQNAIKIVHAGGTEVTMVQIAGFLARRIVCHVEKGDAVDRGERMGMIMFGSRVDLFLPSDAQLRVQRGERVRGGETVVATMRGI